MYGLRLRVFLAVARRQILGSSGEKKREFSRPLPPPHPSGSLSFWVWGPPFGTPPSGSGLKGVSLSLVEEWLGQKTRTLILTEVGLAKVGQPNFGQRRSIKVGQSRSNKDGQTRFGQSRHQPFWHVGNPLIESSRMR